MYTRIEIVDPLTAATPASRILQAAWKPPCLHYSQEYLAWQFTFPGPPDPKVAIGFLNGQAVGCAAITPRQFLYQGTQVSSYLLSFVAVDPIARGRGLAAALYATLLDTIPPETPVLAFAEPDSAGERLLLDAFSHASFRPHVLQTCRAFGFRLMPGSGIDALSLVTVSMGDYGESIAMQGELSHGSTVWNFPTLEQWRHYGADPRQRLRFAIRTADGDIVGTAMAVIAELMSSQGLHRVPMLESVCLVRPAAEYLLAAFNFGALQATPGATVVASNLSYLDRAVVKAAGGRGLPSAFNAHLFVRRDVCGFENSSASNIEVI